MTDDLRSKFKNDLDAAKNAQQLEVGNREIVAKSRADLWKQLQDAVVKGVEDVNSGSPSALMFVVSDVGQPLGFSVIYNRPGGEERKVFAVFKESMNAVTTNLHRKDRNNTAKTYKIIAVNSDASFEHEGVHLSPKNIAERLLNDLV